MLTLTLAAFLFADDIDSIRQSLAQATEQNRKVPDDLQSYAQISAAHIALGDYKKAEEACQTLLDLRPTDVLALRCAAQLREVFGNLSGAIEMWRAVYQRSARSERPAILTNIARIERNSGRLAAAQRLLTQALEMDSGLKAAHAELGRLRMAQTRFAEAAEAFAKAGDLYRQALAQERAGVDAAATYAAFERNAEADSRDRIRYLAARRPAEALALARRESAQRQDLETLDALAVALDANGETQQASDVRKRIDSIREGM